MKKVEFLPSRMTRENVLKRLEQSKGAKRTLPWDRVDDADVPTHRLRVCAMGRLAVL